VHHGRGLEAPAAKKKAELGEAVSAAARRAEPGWFNSGYIFPAGYVSRVKFRSSVAVDQMCLHECSILGAGGVHWPAPTFKVVAMDRPDEPLIAKSCTGCWTLVR
jgi:F/Y-rich N-terminus